MEKSEKLSGRIFSPYLISNNRNNGEELKNQNSREGESSTGRTTEQSKATRLNDNEQETKQHINDGADDTGPGEDNEDIKCSICWDSQTYTDLYELQCKHKFHAMCLINWIKRKSICPMCRFRLYFPGSQDLDRQEENSDSSDHSLSGDDEEDSSDEDSSDEDSSDSSDSSDEDSNRRRYTTSEFSFRDFWGDNDFFSDFFRNFRNFFRIVFRKS